MYWYKMYTGDTDDNVWRQIAYDLKIRFAVVLAVRDVLYNQAAKGRLYPDAVDGFLGERSGTARGVLEAMKVYGYADEGDRLVAWEAGQATSIKEEDRKEVMSSAEKVRRCRARKKAGECVATKTENVTGVTENVTGGVTGVTENVTGGVTGVTENVTGGVTGVTENVTENVTGVTENVTGGVTGVTENVTGGVTGVTENVTGVTAYRYREEKRREDIIHTPLTPLSGVSTASGAGVAGSGEDPGSSNLPGDGEEPLPEDQDETDTADAKPPHCSRRRHRNAETTAPGEEDFARFWEMYPRKVGRQPASLSWNKLRRTKVLPEIGVLLKALAWQKQSEQWTKDGGQYIPHPATWLNGRRWEDESPAPASRASTAKARAWSRNEGPSITEQMAAAYASLCAENEEKTPFDDCPFSEALEVLE